MKAYILFILLFLAILRWIAYSDPKQDASLLWGMMGWSKELRK